ncbi:hypothetical protein L2E82_26295 [Cichorium intybus]|uniref:Uncharacterized protein n=1 Tax=Cichorium intybus TaxID=13427 RepID=A0ACB9E6Q1_CICIN|nr:hypothetical protein L2E82_26295 [Cichorium intybus]
MVVCSYSTATGGQYGVENVIEKLGYETNLLITPERAVGMRMSQSSTRIELASMAFAPPNPFTPLCSFTCFIRLGMSIPFLSLIAPLISLHLYRSLLIYSKATTGLILQEAKE